MRSKPFKRVIGRVEVVVGPNLSTEKRYLIRDRDTGVEGEFEPDQLSAAIYDLIAKDKGVEAFSIAERPDGRLVMSILLVDEQEIVTPGDVVWYLAGAYNVFVAGFLLNRAFYDYAKNESMGWQVTCAVLCAAFGFVCFRTQRKTDALRLRREVRRVSSKP